jgi:hypothetical protein
MRVGGEQPFTAILSVTMKKMKSVFVISLQPSPIPNMNWLYEMYMTHLISMDIRSHPSFTLTTCLIRSSLKIVSLRFVKV